MTDTDRIAQMAREAGLDVRDDWVPGCFVAELGDFARLVAEDCAKVAYQKVAEGKAHHAHTAIRARYK